MIHEDVPEILRWPTGVEVCVRSKIKDNKMTICRINRKQKTTMMNYLNKKSEKNSCILINDSLKTLLSSCSLALVSISLTSID